MRGSLNPVMTDNHGSDEEGRRATAGERLLSPAVATVGPLVTRASDLLEQGRSIDAVAVARRASAQLAHHATASGADVARICHELAAILDELGLPGEAEDMHRRAGTLVAALPPGGDGDRQRVRYAQSLAANLRAQRRDGEAELVLVAALTLSEGLLGPEDIDTVDCTVQLAALLEELGRPEESAAVYRQALGRARSAGLTDAELMQGTDPFGRSTSRSLASQPRESDRQRNSPDSMT